MTMDLVFNPGSIPHLLLLAELLVLLMVVLLVRGHALLRASLVTMTVTGLLWIVSLVLILNLGQADPTSVVLGRVLVGSWALFGPASLMFLLAIDGTLYRRRRLVLGFGAAGVVFFAVTCTTDLVVTGVHPLAWGGWHPSAGPLLIPQAMLLAAPVLTGLVILRSSVRRERIALHVRFGAIIAVLGIFASLDSILACYGFGVYPFAAVPGIAAVLVTLYAIFQHDLLHARGFDRSAAYELVVFCALAPVVFGIAWASYGQSMILALVVLVPIFGGTQAAVILIRRYVTTLRARVSPEAGLAMEEFSDHIFDYRSHADLAKGLIAVLEQHSRLSTVQLWVSDEARVIRRIGDSTTQLTMDERLHEWLTANPMPLDGGDLPFLRINVMDRPLKALLDELGSDVIMPLSDRGRLVGVITAAPPPHGRVLADNELQLLRAVGRASATSLTFINLGAEAEKRIEIANELEVAEGLKQGRTVGEIRCRFKNADVLGHFIPAAQFGGAWWGAYELPDGRALVVIGDVSGRGVPAALVSATASSACQTAQAVMGERCEVHDLLELLNDAVRTVGDERYEMGCCAVIVDWANERITFANGSHQTPYLVRPVPDKPAVLYELAPEGKFLGSTGPVAIDPGKMFVHADDLLVLFSDAVVDARNSAGARYGETNLRRLLQTQIANASDHVHDVILEELQKHCGDQALDDDLSILVVRIGPAA